MIALFVALAGAAGAVFRFYVDSAVKSRLGSRSAGLFPWATVGINVTGSFVLGILAGLVLFRSGSSDVQAVIGTGFCGGYTTFSTASFETVRLVQAGRNRAAAVNALGTVVVAVAACAAGMALVA